MKLIRAILWLLLYRALTRVLEQLSEEVITERAAPERAPERRELGELGGARLGPLAPPLQVGREGAIAWAHLAQLSRTDRARYYAIHGALLGPISVGKA